MRNTMKRAYVVYALVLAFFIGLGFLLYSYSSSGRVWVTNRVNGHLYTNRQLTTAGTVYDRNGTVLAETKDGKRVFSSDYTTRKATLHTVGDIQGYISTGVQTLYRSYLIGYDFVNGVYKTIKDGKGNDITLTIDAEVCKAAYNALGNDNGTVGVYNYKTGEVICMVSKPTFDPENKPSDMDTNSNYGGVYLNRFLSGVFTPGSTFKTLVAICAIENIPDLMTREFTCTGRYKTDDGDVICNSVHGKVTFQQGYNRSCNSVFAELANELGKKKLTSTVESLGFNQNITACGVRIASGNFGLNKANKADLGWAGIGQYTVLANPCNMMMIMGAIANSGEAVTPKVVKNSGRGNLTEILGEITDNPQIKIDENTANTMKRLLRSNVTDYYGESRFSGLEMCGKTGTAEVDNKRPHAWFVGFSQREDLPYAIVVMVENGGSASSKAIPVVGSVMRAVDKAVNGEK